MESALSGDNAALLMKLLEQREAAQAAGEAGAQITEIRHVIIDETPQEKREWFAHARNAKCVHCGHPPFTDALPEQEKAEDVVEFVPALGKLDTEAAPR